MNQARHTQSVWKQLVASSKKSKTGIYTYYVNRNAAIPVTWLMWKIGLTPNAVSLISFTVTHVALALLIALGASAPVAIGAYLLLVLGYILDSSDGQLARVSGKISRLGEWIDHSFDIIKLLTINMTLGYVVIQAAVAADQSLTLPFLAVGLNLLSQPAHFFIVNMKIMLLGIQGPETDLRQMSPATVLALLIRHGADYGLFIMIVLLLPWQEVFVPVYLLYGCFYFVLLVAHFVRTSIRVAEQE